MSRWSAEERSGVVHEVTQRCRVVGLVDASRTMRVVRVRPEDANPFPFLAGQYAKVAFADRKRRSYSIASRPDEPFYEFHIRATGADGTSDYVVNDLRMGEPVTVSGPFGSSWWRAEHAGPAIAVAGGSGFAPIKSIVETALSRGFRKALRLYVGVRSETDLYMESRLRLLAERHRNLVVTPVLSDPLGEVALRRGLVSDAVAADMTMTRLTGYMAYVAGPPPMVDATEAVLLARGMVPEDIHADRF